MGIWATRQTCEPMRNLAWSSNPRARGLLVWPDANFFPRQRCARVCASNTATVSCALTAAVVQEPEIVSPRVV